MTEANWIPTLKGEFPFQPRQELKWPAARVWPDGLETCVFALLATFALVTTLPAATGDTSADRELGQIDFVHGTNNFVDRTGLDLGFVSFIPVPVAVDQTSAHLYVADQGNNRVLGWHSATSFTNGQPADIVIGQPDFYSIACNNAALLIPLCDPTGVAVDRSGNLYVSDHGNDRVLRYSDPFTQGPPITPDLSIDVFDPFGLALDAHGNLYLVESAASDVVEFDAPLSNGESPNLVIGYPGCAAPALSATSLCGPLGVAFDNANNALYVGDTGNNRVLEYDEPRNPPTNTTANRVFGQNGNFNTSGCNVGAAAHDIGGLGPDSLCGPQGVAVDPHGNLYVADQNNHRVLEYDTPLKSGTIAELVFGQDGTFTANSCNDGTGVGDVNGLGPDSLCLPAGVATDSTGNLYIADNGNQRVLGFNESTNPPTNYRPNREVGQFDFFHNTINFVDQNGLNSPTGTGW